MLSDSHYPPGSVILYKPFQALTALKKYFSDITQHFLGVSDFKIMSFSHRVVSLMSDGKQSLPLIQKFLSKVPVDVAGWRSQAFVTASSTSHTRLFTVENLLTQHSSLYMHCLKLTTCEGSGNLVCSHPHVQLILPEEQMYLPTVLQCQAEEISIPIIHSSKRDAANSQKSCSDTSDFVQTFTLIHRSLHF